ncbi:ATP-binding protein [Thermoproteota archaeon]
MLIAGVILFLTAGGIIHICANSPDLPTSYFPHNFIHKPWDLLPLLLFIAAACIIFPLHYKRAPSFFSHALLISTIPAITGQLTMVFLSQQVFDSYFNISSFLKIITYLVFLIGLGLDYIQTYKYEIRGKRRLEYSLKRLNKKKRELEKVNLELDSFVYTASHDLKTPLRGISSFSNFLIDDYSDKLDKEGVKYLERIQKATERMNELINDLLTLSRISRIRHPYKMTNIERLFERILAQYDDDVKHAITTAFQTPLPRVYCDGIKITEVFSNLISNAVKFSDINPELSSKIEIGYNETEEEHCFFVKDNGIGIAPEYHEQIFNIFTKLHSKTEGTGLGLNIVQRIIDEHKGHIWVESEEGRGACFYFTIPKSLTLSKGK